jgi:hypothetical protein
MSAQTRRRAVLRLAAAVLLAVGMIPFIAGAAEVAPILKVIVYKDGRITADGRATTFENLKSMLAALRDRHGAVWYYREASGGEPHPNAMRVINEVIALSLPISLSTKPDFSDAVGPDGIPRPRQ